MNKYFYCLFTIIGIGAMCTSLFERNISSVIFFILYSSFTLYLSTYNSHNLNSKHSHQKVTRGDELNSAKSGSSSDDTRKGKNIRNKWGRTYAN